MNNATNGKLCIEDSLRFARGEYFCTTADVWKVKYKQSEKKHWDAFWRKPKSEEEQRGGVGIKVREKAEKSKEDALDPYTVTREAIEWGRKAAPITSTRSESVAANDARKAIWPVDIVGEDYLNENYQIAHLVPAGKLNHEEWFGVAAAVLGLPRNSSTLQQLMATRGVHTQEEEETNASASKSGAAPPPTKQEAEDQTQSSASSQRPTKRSRSTTFSSDTRSINTSQARKKLVDHTGVVHFVTNKIRLKGQKALLDGKTPKLLLVPCMTLQEATEWRGNGYTAAVLVGLPDGLDHAPEGYDVEKREIDAELAFLDAGMGSKAFQKRYEQSPIISKEHGKRLRAKARQGLEEAVLGISEYVKGLSEADLCCLQESNRTVLRERSGSLKVETPVPEALSDPQKPVLFVPFGSAMDRKLHPAPDPELLLAKAAVVWGQLTGYTLLAAGEQSEEEECSSLDRLAESAFHEKYRSSVPPIPREISLVPHAD